MVNGEYRCGTRVCAVMGGCGCYIRAHEVTGECRDSIRHIHTPTSHSVKYSTPITSKFVFHFRYPIIRNIHSYRWHNVSVNSIKLIKIVLLQV